LTEWGSVHRLIGSIDPEWIVEHLFLDSLLFLRVLPDAVQSILDFGAGAGVPGIPISIVRPGVEMTLLEARQRRVSFLLHVIRELQLSHVRVVATRAEQAAEHLGASYDAVVFRCAGKLERVLPLAVEFAKGGGLVVAAGPPTPATLPIGQWAQVPGCRPGTTRWFAVVRKGG
jgi:16S rRNA (guanine527-N7)-methyltransferase